MSSALGPPYSRRVSSPLPPGPDSSACALETALAERSRSQRRRAAPPPRPRALSGLSFREEVLDAGLHGAGAARPPAAWVKPRETVPPAPTGHRILVVADETQVRLAVARELSPRFDLLHALDFTSAARKLEAGERFSALVMDLGLSDARGASWFLARLVDHAFEGPRILLSRAIPREHASSLSQSCVSHFAFARPWRPGELCALIASALAPRAPQQLARGL